MFDVAIALEVCWLITHCRSWQIYERKIITCLGKKRQTSVGANKTGWGRCIENVYPLSCGLCEADKDLLLRHSVLSLKEYSIIKLIYKYNEGKK